MRSGSKNSVWVLFDLGPADWPRLATETRYTLRPRNGKKGWRWIVQEKATTPPRS